MRKKNPKVLIIATSPKTRGGITSVVKAHEKGEQWQLYKCKWIATHIDKNGICKLLYFFKALLQYVFILPVYDLVHVHLSEPPSAIRKTIFVFYAKLWKKKIIIHFHSFSPETTIKSKYSKLYNCLFTSADRVIVLSNYWKNELLQCFSLREKIVVIYNPCITEKITFFYEKKKQILYAGTVNKRKGYADLIKAFAQVATSFPDWQIIFAGNGEIEEGKGLAQKLNIEKQVSFLGWVSGNDKDKVFKESMIFCLPSYAEGFPMAVLDACAYGLPIITTPVGGIPDVAIDGKNMLLFDAGNSDKLATYMKLLIENIELRESLSKESLKLANEVFNIEVINKKISDLYTAIFFKSKK